MPIEIKGLDEILQKLAALDGQIDGALETAVARTGQAAAGYARRKAPSGSTGGSSVHLKQSIQCDVKGTTAEVKTVAPHAQYVEFGTGWPVGHNRTTKIHRKSGKVVEVKGWFYLKDGTFHFTRGMAPRPFMKPAMTYAQKLMPGEIKRAVQEVIGND